MHLRLHDLSFSFVAGSPRRSTTFFFKARWRSAFPKRSRLAKCISWAKRFGLMGGCSKSYSDQEWKEFRKGRKSSTSWVSSNPSWLSSSHSGMSSDSGHSRTGGSLTSLSFMNETSGAISDSKPLTGLHGVGIKAKADMPRVGDWDNEARMGLTKYALRLRKSVLPCTKRENGPWAVRAKSLSSQGSQVPSKFVVLQIAAWSQHAYGPTIKPQKKEPYIPCQAAWAWNPPRWPCDRNDCSGRSLNDQNSKQVPPPPQKKHLIGTIVGKIPQKWRP